MVSRSLLWRVESCSVSELLYAQCLVCPFLGVPERGMLVAMTMGQYLEGTQLSKLIAGLGGTNGRALPPKQSILHHASSAVHPWERFRGR